MTRPRRPGFTVLECVVSLGVLLVALGGVAQLGTWAVAERMRADARADAADAAVNVLEDARSRPWADLTPAWAADRALPAAVAARHPTAKLTATVEPEPDRKGVKRVTVTVAWANPGGPPSRPVVLVALFADRAGGAK